MATTPYAPPSVGPGGLVVATYPSILADNLQAFLNIYGQNQYVSPDSAIYQLLSILSLKQAHANAGLQLEYNQSSPQTAVGAGLDRVVKMNGLARAAFTYSTAVLNLTGVPGTTLTNAYAQDQNGNLWTIPSPTTLLGGAATVTAQCTTPGNVTAEPGTINIRATPIGGWSSVTNPAAATPGSPIENDSKLRARQSVSVALPSLTTLQSTIAAVLAVNGVVRVAPGYPTPGGPGTSIENPTGGVDYWGNPAHSISMVVQGGADYDVAFAIYSKRGIGPFTNGTTSVVVVDPSTGYSMSISFFRPGSFGVAVFVVLAPLAGFTSAMGLGVQNGLVDYLNSLAIGERVVYSELYGAALTARPNPDQPAFSITSLTSGAQVAQTTGAFTSGSNSVTVASAAGIAIGQAVTDNSNPGSLPNGVTVTNISGTTLTLSANSLAASTADQLSFFVMSNVDLVPLFTQAALGLASNVQVTT